MNELHDNREGWEKGPQPEFAESTITMFQVHAMMDYHGFERVPPCRDYICQEQRECTAGHKEID